MTRVLIIEDAPEAAELATAVMRGAGFVTSTAHTGREALRMAHSLPPDVVLLDLGLPDTDGTDLCRALREFSDAYIVMLTSRDDEIDKVVGLKMGADDYVTKPYSPREVLARVEALLRRPRHSSVPRPDRREVGDLVVDVGAHRVSFRGEDIELTRIEFAILDALTEHSGRVLSRSLLRERVWGEEWGRDDHIVDVHIANLRRKIDCDGVRHITTVRGVGYRTSDLGDPA